MFEPALSPKWPELPVAKFSCRFSNFPNDYI
jgi:hypothetical protein